MFRHFRIITNSVSGLTGRSYAKAAAAGGKKAAPAASQQSKHLEVETDPEKLCKYVCGANILIDGSDPEIKPDSEYPDWLWTLRTERGGPDLKDLDMDSYKYWKIVRRREIIRRAKLREVKYKFKEFG